MDSNTENNPWRSARLVYTAIDTDDEPFLTVMRADASSFVNMNPAPPLPGSKKDITSEIEYFRDSCLLAVKICLQPAAPSPDEASPNPIPIGKITLTGLSPRTSHHRNSSIGISILNTYQGQGYGSEAIRWVLRWAFMYGNLHRIEIGAFAWNEGAWKLYERLGFVKEGVKREHFFSAGRYWDAVDLGMLEGEWRRLYGSEVEKVGGSGWQNGESSSSNSKA
ncbi:hypothetical protein LTR08_005245 [Meristemomyces frigidus]|nr:hypothetical protein LTR08_005245 [Meristemomyces frigidus]